MSSNPNWQSLCLAEEFEWNHRFALWIGGIWPVKNPLQIAEIARAMPDLDFVVIGSSRDMALFERLMLEKPDNVHYVGPVNDPLKTTLIRKCSFGLITSIRETFGWTPFEFLKEGKTVVCPRLKAFEEIYGNLLVYANTTRDFIQCIKELEKNEFRTQLEQKALLDLREKYNLTKAANVIIKELSGGPIMVLARDTSIRSDYVTGFFLVDWKLLKNIYDKGIALSIISNGTKYATQFGLLGRTTLIPMPVLSLIERIQELEQSSRRREIANRKVLRFISFLVEPLSYVFCYLRHPQRALSQVIFAEGRAQMAAAVILRLVFRLRTVCLLHDDGFYRELWEQNVPIIWKIFDAALTRTLRHVDRLIVVSQMLRQEVLVFYPYPDRVTLMWQDS